jgi:hypothetical protein
MSIGSVGGASNAAYTQAVQRSPEATEVKKPGPDGDRDKDDGASKVQPSPAPSVNSSGQVVGQVINTTA